MALAKNHQQTLDRGLIALMQLNARGPATVQQLATALSVPRGTSHRILETLARSGFVARNAGTGAYHLTEQVRRLSDGYTDDGWITDCALPVLERFTEETGWPCALATPSAESMIIRATTDFRSSMVLTYWPVGCRFPILRASSGVAYAAFCQPRLRGEIVKMLFADKTEGSEKFTVASLQNLLTVTRREGYCCLANSEFREGGLGVPFFINKKVRGGLLMRFIKSAVEMKRIKQHYAPLLAEAAEAISRDVALWEARSQARAQKAT